MAGAAVQLHVAHYFCNRSIPATTDLICILIVQVRRAQDAKQLAVAAVQLQASLRRTVLPLNWERLPAQPAAEPPPLPPGLFNISAVAMCGARPAVCCRLLTPL